MKREEFEVTGTITDCYEDIGPACRVVVTLPGGGTITFDASDLPFDWPTLKASIGKILWTHTVATIRDVDESSEKSKG